MAPAKIAAISLTRARLAKATGCNLETIRYYENIGVMPEPPRSANGYRIYDATQVSRLNFIIRSRDLGFSLKEIRSLLALVDGGIQTCAEVQKFAQTHFENVHRKIEDLQLIEAALSETIKKCSGRDVPECAVIDALSAR